MSMDYNWLQKLKPGDKVVVHSWYAFGGCTYEVKVIEKITPTGFIKVDGLLYKKNGCVRNVHGNSKLLNPDDGDVMNKVKAYQEKKFISNVLYRLRNLNSLTVQQANKFKSLLDEVKKEVKENGQL